MAKLEVQKLSFYKKSIIEALNLNLTIPHCGFVYDKRKHTLFLLALQVFLDFSLFLRHEARGIVAEPP